MNKFVILTKDGNKIRVAVENSQFLMDFGWEIFREPIKIEPVITVADKANKGATTT